MQNKFFSIIKKIIGIAKSKTIIAMTLAEVMITLAVVGIISAMVIPALVNSINDKELKTQWLKTYATVVQATQMMMTDNGGDMTGLSFLTCGDLTDAKQKMNLYASYYNSRKVLIQANCGGLPGTLASLYKVANGRTIIEKPDGTFESLMVSGGEEGSGGGIILDNGTFLFYTTGSTNCTYGSSVHKTLGGRCFKLGIYVDINGAKPPNMWGKDFFQIQVAKNGAYPTGVDPATLSLNTCDSANYYNCGAWILANPDFQVPY